MKGAALARGCLLICDLECGCGAQAMIKKGEAAVDNFHSQLDAGTFDQIHTESDNTLTNSTSQGKFVGTLRTVSLKLGHINARVLSDQ